MRNPHKRSTSPGVCPTASRPEVENRAEEFLHLALDDYVRFGMPDYAAEAERMLSATSRSF